MDDPALLNLVALLQLPIPLSKFSLSRLYLNLCLHPDTCSLLLRFLLALLRAPIRSGSSPQGIPSNPLPYPSQVRALSDSEFEPCTSTLCDSERDNPRGDPQQPPALPLPGMTCV